MSAVTKIEWSDRSWNPVTGCSKVSEGCRNCYAEAMSLRFKRSVGPWNAVNAPLNVIQHADRLTDPLSWKKPARVFVNSMSDLFHELVPDEFIDQVFAIMALTPRHTYQILTKRPERMAQYVSDLYARDFDTVSGKFNAIVDEFAAGRQADDFVQRNGAIFHAGDNECNRAYVEHDLPKPIPNVWLGTSVENNDVAFDRLRWLMETPAATRFLSMEPLLGPVDLLPWMTTFCQRDQGDCDWLNHRKPCTGCQIQPEKQRLHWVIVGGESGSGARPMHPDWARDLRDQCVAAGVPFFFKQVGAWAPHDHADSTHIVARDGTYRPRSSFTRHVADSDLSDLSGLGMVRIKRVGNKAAGRLLDGVEWSQFPDQEVSHAESTGRDEDRPGDVGRGDVQLPPHGQAAPVAVGEA